jgi:pyruvate/2-oxoglutarate dehydrogenase complex dihydrolipoamide acyltransferase (E2) component
MTDRYEKLNGAQRWFYDGLSILRRADFSVSEEVDMTATQQLIALLRQQGIHATYTHVVVRATALALTRHPELNRLLLKNQIVYPDTIDIGLAVDAGSKAVFPPRFIINDAEQKTVLQITREIIQRALELRERGKGQGRQFVRKSARLVPTSWLRQSILRRMTSQLSTVKQRTGTIHITCLPHLQQGVPLVLSTPAVLAFARVEDRVVAKDGLAVVLPMATFSMAGDDRLWNGTSVGLFLHEIKTILQELDAPALQVSEQV